MTKTKVEELAQAGQSIWLDNINRSLIDSGKLGKMITLGLAGLTSNPTIFDQAISQSPSYDQKIKELFQSRLSIFEIYDNLTVKDIQEAADLFKSVYEKTKGQNGYVSLEVNPQLAAKTPETIKEAKRLYHKVSRPNLMLKIPATDAGFEAMEALLAMGINVNATLIFSLRQYEKTSEAFLNGLKKLNKKTNDLNRVNSVASVFVSRVDTVVDKMLEERIIKENNSAIKEKIQSLRGKAAVANCRMIYNQYQKIQTEKEMQTLKEKGARAQRVLWASTSTKNKAYSDIKYVTELIGENTINTIPENTWEAFLDHAQVQEVLPGDIKEAQGIIGDLKSFGIDVDAVCEKLLEDGVVAFEKSFNSLLDSIEKKVKDICPK